VATHQEQIDKVEILDSGEVLLHLRSGGRPEYQYIYRGARAVYWDQALGGFRSSDRRDWSSGKWFEHIVEVCASIGVELRLAEQVSWINIPDKDRQEISRSQCD